MPTPATHAIPRHAHADPAPGLRRRIRRHRLYKKAFNAEELARLPGADS